MSRPRILVVDDEPGMLRSVERVLAPRYDVRTVRLPSQALESASAEPFALALLDIRMPEMDGFELMGRLTALRPDLEVILMTGSVDERDTRLVRAIRERAYFFLTKPFDREVLLTLIERCLETHRLDAENRAHVERLERELQAAHVFQQSLLPERTASWEGVEIALHYEPSGELCGDFCDYGSMEGTCAAIVTDVAGHGAPAAMLTGMIKQVFQASAPKGYAPEVVMQRILTASRHFPHDKHLTGICVRVHPGAGALEYVNAGHPPGLLLSADGSITRLESSAPMVHHAFSEWPCEQQVVRMAPGDRLLLYTDGLLEARDTRGEDFGLERIEGAFRELASGEVSGARALEALRAELGRFIAERPLDDDLTMVLVTQT